MRRTATCKQEEGAASAPGLTPIGEIVGGLVGVPPPTPYKMGGYRTPVYGPCTRFGITGRGRAALEASVLGLSAPSQEGGGRHAGGTH